MQPVGQALFFRQLGHPLRADHRQLAFKLGNPCFKQAVGIGQLSRHLVEQRERLLKPFPTGLLHRIDRRSNKGHGLPCEIREGGLLGGLGHGTFSRG